MKLLKRALLSGVFVSSLLSAATSLATQAPVAKAVQSSAPSAEWYRLGLQQYQQKHYKNAFNLLQKAAQQNHAESQMQLAWMYRQGQGVAQNYPLAAALFAQAASQNINGAAFYAGLMYSYLGENKLAVQWFFKASQQDDVEAHIRLGDLYMRGALPLPKVNMNSQDEARKYYKKAEPINLDSYLKAANEGDVDAQIRLAQVYEYGIGVKQNYTQALQWYQKAAKQNESYAQFELGMQYYLDGNAKRAVNWFEKAANQGYAHAQFYMGIMYAYGSGVAKNSYKALYWFEQAAKHNESYADKLAMMFADGIAVSQNRQKSVDWHARFAQHDAVRLLDIAKRYRYGNQVSANNKQALYWYQQAANQGALEASFWLAYYYANAQMGLAKNLKLADSYFESISRKNFVLSDALRISPYQSYPAIQKTDLEGAQAWLKQKAQLGDSYAQYTLAVLENEQTLALYLQSAQQGHVPSQIALSRLYLSGRYGIPRNPSQALFWLTKAAEQGDVGAAAQLALVYRLGTHGQKVNLTQMIYWYQQLADKNDVYAQLMLGFVYSSPDYPIKDMTSAINWFKKAAAGQSPMAAYQLGRLYSEGVEVTQDLKQAAYWLNQVRDRWPQAEVLWQRYQLSTYLSP